jgi:hypothetical protein
MAGRPKTEINQKTFENLCKIQCTKKEIASVLDCGISTIERWCKSTYKMNFEDARDLFAEGGKASLRRIQWQLAEKNAGMAIFLGKQYLNQRDSYDVVDNTPIEKLDAILTSLKKTAKDEQGNK